MKRFFKVLKYLSLVIFIAALGVGGWLGYQFSQPTSVLLEKNIKKYAGFTAVVDPEASLSLWPALVLNVPRLTIQAFSGDKPLFSGEDIHFALMPWLDMLNQGVAVDRVSVQNPDIYLSQPATGLPNWKSPYRRSSSSSDGSFKFIPIKVVDIQHLNFTYQNAKEGQFHRLENANVFVSGANASDLALKFEGLYNEQAFNFDGSMDIRDLQRIPLTLKASSGLASFDAQGTVITQNMFSGRVHVTVPDVTDLLQTYAPQTELPVDLSGALSVNADVRTSPEALNVQSLTVRLADKLDVSGTANLAWGTQKMTSRLTVARLNLDALALCGGATSSTKGGGGAPWNDTPLNTAALTSMPFDFEINVKDMTCQSFPARGFDVVLKNDGRVLSLARGDVYFPQSGMLMISGKTSLSSGVDGSLLIHLDKLPLELFLSGKVAQKLRLPLDGDIRLERLKGKTTRQLAENLNGSVDLGATSGVLPGSVLTSLALSLEKTFSGVLNTTNELDRVSVQYVIENGIAKAEDVSVHAANDQVNLTATGKIDLPNWTIYHRVEPVVRASTAFKVPVNIKGSLSSPSIVPEVTNLQNLATGAGAVVGGPVGAAAGAVLGRMLSGGQPAKDVSATDAGSSSKTKVINPLDQLIKGLTK